jgi:catechol 2,3-dioxygenase-like lactoylglutathione lyase family enzyme
MVHRFAQGIPSMRPHDSQLRAMITGLDHVVLVCPSIERGEAAYTTLLGREADWRTQDAGGSASVMYQWGNTALELMAPTGAGPVARRLHALIDSEGAGPKSLVFASSDIAATRTLLERRGLKPDAVAAAESVDPFTARARYWQRFRLDESVTHGVRVFVLQRRADDPVVYKAGPPGTITALDHVVVNTANPDRATAFYGARLGLRLALDRSNPDWDMRLMFFRTGAGSGDLTVELAHKLSVGPGAQPDRLWGFSWRTADIDATHDRMANAGLAVTSIRPGRRPGTRVFTVKDGTINTPTLILSAETAKGAA